MLVGVLAVVISSPGSPLIPELWVNLAKTGRPIIRIMHPDTLGI